MKSIRLVVIGNCQARPLARLLMLSQRVFEVLDTIVVHLAKNADFEIHRDKLESADYIITQRVADNYPCEFVRTAQLRDRYGERVIVWPNIYWRGYNPELFYLKGLDGRPLPGPLGDYHIHTIYRGWIRQECADDIGHKMMSVEFNREHYSGIEASSLDELSERELDCDIKISDLIIENRWRIRLFYTFNHPSRWLLEKVAERIARSISREGVSFNGNGPEPLARFKSPINPWVRDQYAFNIADTPYQGNSLKIEGQDIQPCSDIVIYSLRELMDAYLRLYEQAFPASDRQEQPQFS